MPQNFQKLQLCTSWSCLKIKSYHSVWNVSSVLFIPILTRKFLTKSSTTSGLLVTDGFGNSPFLPYKINIWYILNSIQLQYFTIWLTKFSHCMQHYILLFVLIWPFWLINNISPSMVKTASFQGKKKRRFFKDDLNR